MYNNVSVLDVHGRLIAEGDLLELARDPAELHHAIAAIVNETFHQPMAQLNVVSELRRRYAGEELGRIIRQRIHESFEFVQLKDNCDHEHKVCLVRLLGVDESIAGDLLDVANRYDYRQRGVPFQAVNNPDPDRIVFLQFRAAFPISELKHFERMQQSDLRVLGGNAFEKLHASPPARALPEPGRPLLEKDAQVLTLRAWITNRLVVQAGDAGLFLTSVDGSEQPIMLGRKLQMFRTPDGYRRAVDIVSFYEGFYYREGPDVIRTHLARLADFRAGRGPANDPLLRKLAALVDEETAAALERELGWWLKNSSPAVMRWNNTPRKSGDEGWQ